KPDDRFASFKEFRHAFEEAIAPPKPVAVAVVKPAPAPALPSAPKPMPTPSRIEPVRAEPTMAPVTPLAGRKRRRPAEAPLPEDPVEVARIERVQTKKVGGKLREIISQRIAANRLMVPAMPVVALRCLEIMRDPNAEFSDIASTIEKDPLIASRLLRIV